VVSQLGDEYRCVVPKQVLVRVRASFRDSITLRLINRRSFYAADGRVERAQITVQTLAGKPLVYTDVADSGRARLFTGTGCA